MIINSDMTFYAFGCVALRHRILCGPNTAYTGDFIGPILIKNIKYVF